MDFDADKLLAESVCELLRTSFLNHRCLTAQRCADALGMSVRNMQRRLSTTDLTFSTLLDEVRFDLAKGQLLHSSNTIDEIARTLGFSTQESFIQAFHRWSGVRPREFRRQSSS